MDGQSFQEAKQSVVNDAARSIGGAVNEAIERDGLRFPDGMAGADLIIATEDLAAAAVNKNLYPDQEITGMELEATSRKFREVMAREFPQWPESFTDKLVENALTSARLGTDELMVNAQGNGEGRAALTQVAMASLVESIKESAGQVGASLPQGSLLGELEYYTEQLATAVTNNTLRPDQENTQADLAMAAEQLRIFMFRELPQIPISSVEKAIDSASADVSQGIQRVVQDVRENGMDIREQVKDSYRPEYNGDLPYQRKSSDGDMVRG